MSSHDKNYEFEAAGEAFFLEEDYEITFRGRTYTRTRVMLAPRWVREDRIEHVDARSAKIIYDEQ